MIKTVTINGQNLVFDSDKHKYWISGIEAPSVTTITNQLDKSNQLVWWSANIMVKYLHDEFEKIISGELELNPDSSGKLLAKARTHHEQLREAAAELGSKTHHLIEYNLTNRAVDVPDDIAAAYTAYLDWKNSYEIFEPIAAEIMTYSHSPCLYAGTADWIINLNGKVTLGDIKTSNGIYPEYLFQISAYRYALTRTNKFKIDSMGILRLDKVTGIPEWTEFSEEQYQLALKIFRHLCRVFHLRKELKI